MFDDGGNTFLFLILFARILPGFFERNIHKCMERKLFTLLFFSYFGDGLSTEQFATSRCSK